MHSCSERHRHRHTDMDSYTPLLGGAPAKVHAIGLGACVPHRASCPAHAHIHIYAHAHDVYQHLATLHHPHKMSCVCVRARCPWLAVLSCVCARCPWPAPPACPLGQAQASELAAACKAAMIAAPAGAARRWGATGRRRASPRVAPIAPHHLAQVARGRRGQTAEGEKEKRRESQEFWRGAGQRREKALTWRGGARRRARPWGASGWA